MYLLFMQSMTDRYRNISVCYQSHLRSNELFDGLETNGSKRFQQINLIKLSLVLFHRCSYWTNFRAWSRELYMLPANIEHVKMKDKCVSYCINNMLTIFRLIQVMLLLTLIIYSCLHRVFVEEQVFAPG